MGYQLWAIVKIKHFLTRLNFELTKKSHIDGSLQEKHNCIANALISGTGAAIFQNI